MHISELMRNSLSEMEAALAELLSIVPPARQVPFADSFVFRHTEKRTDQAIVQKLSRIPSGLRAATALCNLGYFQEQGALQRVVDEIGEDVLFLSIALIYPPASELHERYLEAFFAEEFDAQTGKPLDEPRPMIPRKKIRAAIAQSPVSGGNPSGHIDASRVVFHAYSGFVHGASPHIMDSFGGDPPRFFTRGMLGTPREQEFREDIVNYYYRGLSAFVMGARAVGHEPCFRRLYELSRVYQSLGVG